MSNSNAVNRPAEHQHALEEQEVRDALLHPDPERHAAWVMAQLGGEAPPDPD